MPKYKSESGMSFSSRGRLYRRFHREAAEEQLRRRNLPQRERGSPLEFRVKNRPYFLEFQLRPNENDPETVYKNVFGLRFVVSKASQYNMAFGIVSGVTPDGVAERQGIMVGDIVCGMNRKPLPPKIEPFMLNDTDFKKEHSLTVLGNNPIRLLRQNDQDFVNFILGAQRRHRVTFLRDSLDNDPYAFLTLDLNVTHPQTQNQFRLSILYFSYARPLSRNAYLGTGDIITSINGKNVFGERYLDDSLNDIISQMGIPKTIQIEIIPTSVLRRYPTAPESDIMQHSVVTRPSLLIGPLTSQEESFNLEWGWPPVNPRTISRSQSVSDVSSSVAEDDDFMRPGPSNVVASATRKPIRLRHRRASFDSNA